MNIFRIISVLLMSFISSISFADTYMATYQGYDAPGNDYNVIDTTNVSECKNACNNDNKCIAFTLNKVSQRCWLKSSIGEISDSDVKDVTFGIKAIKAVDNIDRPGMDFKSTNASDVNVCSHMCFVNKKCMAFTYNKGSKVCNLKSGVPNPISDSAGISGVK